MHHLEKLKTYALFGVIFAEQFAPYFYALCQRLIDPADHIPIAVNRYFAKNGQYSASWNKRETKKKDLLLRVIRLLNKV
jgi:allantoicase